MLGVIEVVDGGRKTTFKKAVIWEKSKGALYCRIPKRFLAPKYEKRLLRAIVPALRGEGCAYYLVVGSDTLKLDGFIPADHREYLLRRLPEAIELFLKEQGITPALMTAALVARRADRAAFDLLLCMGQYAVNLIFVTNDTDKAQIYADRLYYEFGLPIVVQAQPPSLPRGCAICLLLERAPFAAFGIAAADGTLRIAADGFEIKIPDCNLPSYSADIDSLTLAGCMFYASKDRRILDWDITALSHRGLIDKA